MIVVFASHIFVLNLEGCFDYFFPLLSNSNCLKQAVVFKLGNWIFSQLKITRENLLMMDNLIIY